MTTTPIDQTDLNERKAVWLALSDLFLDTDVTVHYDSIAGVCSRSRYSMGELKNILEKEVAPVCGANLFCVAGEWAGFDEAWLVNSILAKAFNKVRLSSDMLMGVATKRYVNEHWEVLENLIGARRGHTDT